MPSVIPDKISDFEMKIPNKENATPQPIKVAGDVQARGKVPNSSIYTSYVVF